MCLFSLPRPIGNSRFFGYLYGDADDDHDYYDDDADDGGNDDDGGGHGDDDVNDDVMAWVMI